MNAHYEFTTTDVATAIDGESYPAGTKLLRKERTLIPMSQHKFLISSFAQAVFEELNQKVHPGEELVYAEFTAFGR